MLQDFTGVPAVVDLAAMRAAVVRMTGDPASARLVNPLVQVDLVVDHSVQVDVFNSRLALQMNSEREVRAQPRALRVSQVGPVRIRQLPRGAPATGIVHQVNLSTSPKCCGTSAEDSSPTRWSALTRTPR